jgi:hypothetical protein
LHSLDLSQTDHDEIHLEAETHEVQDEELLELVVTDEVDHDENHELNLSTIRRLSIFDE